MHVVENAVVRDGKLVLTNLPFSDGEHVRVIVADIQAARDSRRTIAEVQELLRGSVERFDDPFEGVLPPEDSDMFK